jgi:hypothetical protein
MVPDLCLYCSARPPARRHGDFVQLQGSNPGGPPLLARRSGGAPFLLTLADPPGKARWRRANPVKRWSADYPCRRSPELPTRSAGRLAVRTESSRA